MRKGSTLAKLGLVAALASTVAACGKEEAKTPEAQTKTPEANQPVTLKMMTTQHALWPYKEDWPIYKFIK